MELIDQHTKKIMEECKEKARAVGLKFGNETLEYIVTNRDMIRLMGKNMIPTLYDYWVHDVQVLRGQGAYNVYPTNPYETVIDSRPAISFYNDNNPDWLNKMIFYHVLAHIDFYRNNRFYEHNWGDDFVGQALADKRLIEKLRSEHGRWVDYTIEFSRGLDNIVGYFKGLSKHYLLEDTKISEKIEFYFDNFLQDKLKVPHNEFLEEMNRYNRLIDKKGRVNESKFFSEVRIKHPEFQALFKKHKEKEKRKSTDLLEYIINNSPKLKKEDNKWMTPVVHIVRDTGIYFAPHLRTKIINEGWASYWHDELFRKDESMNRHEVAYAKVDAGVTSIPRVGLNPYAIGSRLIRHVEELVDKGKLSYDFQKISDSETRKEYDKKTGKGKEAIFKLRENFSDFMLINTFVDQEFVDKHSLFVVAPRLNLEKGTVEFYVKSKKAEDYKRMLLDKLYHPPDIHVNEEKTNDSNLYLVHNFEGKQLIPEYIPNTMLGVEFLWGSSVQLETTELATKIQSPMDHIMDIINYGESDEEEELEYQRVLYTVKDRKVYKKVIDKTWKPTKPYLS